MSRVLDHLRGNVVGYVALFVALGGSAFAAGALNGPAPGTNSVGSLDVINGQILSKDLGNGSVTASKLDQPQWHEVAPSPETAENPCASGQTAVFCGAFDVHAIEWHNYGGGWQTARFRRDADGEVYVQGLVLGEEGSTIFILPQGYRPDNTLTFAVDCKSYPEVSYDTHGRVDVQADGEIVWPGYDHCNLPTGYLSLTGVVFHADH